MSIDAATDAEVFRAFVRYELAPHLREGDIVVMDNLSAHKDAEARASSELPAPTSFSCLRTRPSTTPSKRPGRRSKKSSADWTR
jgi:transposase